MNFHSKGLSTDKYRKVGPREIILIIDESDSFFAFCRKPRDPARISRIIHKTKSTNS